MKACSCSQEHVGRGTVTFAIDGVQHAAPEIWMVGRRMALERSGVPPPQAAWMSCRDWAEQCAAIEARA